MSGKSIKDKIFTFADTNPTNPDNAFQDCQTISSAVGYAVADSG
jgi:hypothetical protein